MGVKTSKTFGVRRVLTNLVSQVKKQISLPLATGFITRMGHYKIPDLA
jgi:hypothetical protein